MSHEADTAATQLESFDTEEEIQQRVLMLVGTPTWVHVFYGWCGGISAPPFRYLMLPGKEPFPLFSPPQAPQLQDGVFTSAYLGPANDWEDPDLLGLNEEAETEEPAAETDEDVPLDEVLEPEDEFYFDDEDEGEEA